VKPVGWTRVILFWMLMVFLALVLLKMELFGTATKLERFLNFVPLVLVFALFLFVLGMERSIRHKSSAEQEHAAR
jgi:hypothetical protein